jgi:myosin heavy subunit
LIQYFTAHLWFAAGAAAAQTPSLPSAVFAHLIARSITMASETVGVGDMVLLDPITEENLVENLRKRFMANEIYVCAHS